MFFFFFLFFVFSFCLSVCLLLFFVVVFLFFVFYCCCFVVVVLLLLLFFVNLNYGYFFHFSMKTYVVGEVLLMSTHNICFRGEKKTFLNTIHIWSNMLVLVSYARRTNDMYT